MSKRKKVTIIVICAALIIALACVLLIPLTLVRRTENISQEEAAEYQKYEMDLESAELGEGETAADFILSRCEFVSTETADNVESDIYEPADLAQYIPMCGAIEEVARIDASVYVQYTATDGLEVTLCYIGDDLASMAVYNEDEDTLFELADSQARVRTRFRNGYDSWSAALDNIYGALFR